MNRFKFRAWDKVNKKIIIDDPYSSRHLFMTWDGNVYDKGKLQQFIMMQYTGLNDKNGKEIYEGDIVKYTRNDNSSHCGEQSTHEIYFDCGSFVKKVKTSVSPYFAGAVLGIYNQDCEIIGNIYENPELGNG